MTWTPEDRTAYKTALAHHRAAISSAKSTHHARISEKLREDSNSPRKWWNRINDVLNTLTFREREIIKLRYGIGDGYTYTLEEVGKRFMVTRERVRQIEAKAVR